MGKKNIEELKKKYGEINFDNVRLNENGKFIDEHTQILQDGDFVTFINTFPDGEIQKFVIKLRKKK